MTQAIEDSAAGPPGPRRIGVRGLLIAAALLAAAVLPVAVGDRRADWEMLGGEARALLAAEAHTRRAMAEGEAPLWNPYQFGGRPHLADPATLALYPPHVVLRLLPIDVSFLVGFVLHGWVFGYGAYRAARALGAATVASLLAAAGAMLAVVLAPRADVPYTATLYAVAWVPLLVALTIEFVERRRLVPSATHAATLAMALTAPPPSQEYAFASVGLCLLVAVLAPAGDARRVRRLAAQAVVLFGLGLGLAAFQLVPYVRLVAAARWTGGFADHVPGDQPDARSIGDHALVAAPLTSAAGSRTMSECDGIDASEFLWFGVPGAGGRGAFLHDYGTYVALAGTGRDDLRKLLNVGSVVGCRSAEDALPHAGDAGRPTISPLPGTLPRAFWTCAPSRAGRSEIEHRLRELRYDDTLTLRDPDPVIHVRWGAALDDAARAEAEAALHLRPRQAVEDRTWQYDLLDASRENLRAIVDHAAVEDTAGFERGALTLPRPSPAPAADERRPEWLLGAGECGELRPARILQADRADGHFVATIDAPGDGVLFVSETYYADRTGWVDGSQVSPLKVNLAFTGIPVTTGRHLVELRAGTGSLWLGASLTALTMVLLAIGAARERRS